MTDGSGLPVAGSRQVEFRGSAYRGPAVGHGEFGVDVLGVRPHGVQRHHELAGDGRAVQLGSEQPEHIQLTLAQRVDQGLPDRAVLPGLAHRGQEPADIVPGRPLFLGGSQQGTYRRALIDEDPDVTLRFSQRQGPFQAGQRSRDVPRCLERERLKHQDFR